MNQPLAYIHPEAKIAQNVVVEPFSTIYKNVEIGEGTWIGPNVTIMEGARIGKNCKIYPGAVISSVPQDLKFAGEDTIAIIGDNTVIRECVTVSRGTIDKMKTVIGSNCLIMSYAHIAHDCIVGNNCIVVNAVQMAGHVEMAITLSSVARALCTSS
ncbi:UDP-N-acetylglucosamine acyltransferase [Pontibacter sp. BAB1700]|nr:UDP-N-acetylglucosamine acyltransferase [Pontibacter sp. BAB1700]